MTLSVTDCQIEIESAEWQSAGNQCQSPWTNNNASEHMGGSLSHDLCVDSCSVQRALLKTTSRPSVLYTNGNAIRLYTGVCGAA